VHWRFAVQVACALLTPIPAGGTAAARITCSSTTAAGVPLKVVTIPLDEMDTRITGQVPKYGSGHSEPFGQMVRRARPTVAITGTFFCPRTLQPVGDIVIDGQLAHFGGLGTAMCVSDNNEVEFIRPPRYTPQDWGRFSFVVCAGPRLVKNGVAYVHQRGEGFRDRNLFDPNARIAIGVTADRRMVIAATRKHVYLSRMARAMRALGVVDAINLDGGTSVGLYYRGAMIMRPSRRLTNLIVVYEDRWLYENEKDALLPAKLRAAGR
jgi:hypothetical protein